jgi:hypothetical protein
VAAVLLTTILVTRSAPAAEGLSDGQFDRLCDQLRLKNQRWAGIPWKVNVTEARRAAHAQRKPVFLVVNTGNCAGWV